MLTKCTNVELLPQCADDTIVRTTVNKRSVILPQRDIDQWWRSFAPLSLQNVDSEHTLCHRKFTLRFCYFLVGFCSPVRIITAFQGYHVDCRSKNTLWFNKVHNEKWQTTSNIYTSSHAYRISSVSPWPNGLKRWLRSFARVHARVWRSNSVTGHIGRS